MRQLQPLGLGVRAVEHRVYAPAQRGELAVHLGVDGDQGLGVEQAAAQARLVGGQHHMPAAMVQLRHGLQRAGQGVQSAAGR